MARASDYEGIHRGLDSIRQSIMQRKLEEYRAERDAEERGRYEAQTARQLKLDTDMGAYRTAQQKAQADAAAAAAADRKAMRDRLAAQDALKAQGAAAVAEKQKAFSSAFEPEPDLNLGAPEEGMIPAPGLEPTPENILKQGVKTGALTPAQLAEMALAMEKSKAAGAAVDNKPQTFELDMPDGAKAYGIYNPKTGNFETKVNGHTLEAVPLKDKTTGAVIPNKYVVGTGAQAKVLDVTPKPVNTDTLFKRYWEVRDRIYGNNEKTGLPNFPIKARTPENPEWQMAQVQEQTIAHAIRAATGQLAPETGPGAASAPAATPAKPAMKFDITDDGKAQPTGTPAPREQEPAPPATPPVSVQPPKAEVAPRLRGLSEPAAPAERSALKPTGRGSVDPLVKRAGSLAEEIRASLATLERGVGSRGLDQTAYNSKYQATRKLIEQLQALDPAAARQFLE